MPILTNPQWEDACQARANGADIAAAYKSAGYSGKPASATMFFKRANIRERVSEIQSERWEKERRATEIATKKLALTKEWVLERLAFNAEQSLRGHPIRDAEGRPTGKFGRPNENAANRALELIGRELGMFIERQDIRIHAKYEQLTDRELLQELEQVTEQLAIADQSEE